MKPKRVAWIVALIAISLVIGILGATSRAGYDSPWTPALLRRNEVLLRVR